ncbi:MAG: Asp-tRNA(Asn)/Glu-tRNA(Gln) amidotransferase subunit GatC [Fimbriimonadia bacterium]|jgi:aspartyl-tRNA(Asn)/glutamyl-tRNA(Gln) amidotransferase subunit C
MALSIEQVRHIAKLARLQMTEEEMEAMLPHLQEMVDRFGRLSQVDTEGLEPTSHSAPLENVWREDEPSPQGEPSAILKGAAEARNGLFLVPAILTQDEA